MTIDHLPLRVILGKVCTQGRLEDEFCYARLGAAKEKKTSVCGIKVKLDAKRTELCSIRAEAVAC